MNELVLRAGALPSSASSRVVRPWPRTRVPAPPQTLRSHQGTSDARRNRTHQVVSTRMGSKIMTPNLIDRAVKLPDCVDGDCHLTRWIECI